MESRASCGLETRLAIPPYCFKAVAKTFWHAIEQL